MSRRSYAALLLLGLLVIAAVVRFENLNWDQQIGAHPDERYIVDAASRLSFPDGLNPLDTTPQFAYGHLPLYLLALARWFAPSVEPLLLGRGLSALFDLGTVLLTFELGRQASDRRTGLLAAAFVTLMVAHVQQAHFYTPDTALSFLVLSALLFAVRFVQNGNASGVWFAGGAAGLALGTKATAGLLVVPLGVACSLRSEGRLQAALQCGLATLVSFAAFNPFALLDLPPYLNNLARQASVLRGALDAPYTRQYHATMPYIYPIVQQLRWGMGWLVGSYALAGLAYEVSTLVRSVLSPTQWVMLAWLIPYFGFFGGLYAKFPRYVLPIIPLFAILAADLLTDLLRWRRMLAAIMLGLILGSLLLRCLALMTMYQSPHPWKAASEWIYDHAEPGSKIAFEAWDHPLPVDAREYTLLELPIFDEETPAKWQAVDTTLSEAEFLIIASRRGYASLARWPARYGQTSRYYRRLFDGDLGFEPVACFDRHPHLGPFSLIDDPTAGLPFSLPSLCQSGSDGIPLLGRLDESFVVYDHPTVIVFQASR